MSEISSIHTFIAFDSKTTKRPEGQRFVKLSYKKESKKGPNLPSVCTAVPFITAIDDAVKQRLIPHIVTMLENAQDDIARARYEAGASGVSDSEISLLAVCDWLDSQANGDRLTSEAIAQWFRESVSDNLSLLLADKLRIEDSTPTSDPRFKTLEQSLNSYKDHFASLAGGKTQKTLAVARSMLNVLDNCADADDSLAGRFSARLKKMIAKIEAETSDALVML